MWNEPTSGASVLITQNILNFTSVFINAIRIIRNYSKYRIFKKTCYPFKDEAQTALFKGPVRTVL